MEDKIREAQLKVLKLFSKCRSSFALTGGTALELFYLKHRFSRDLDFFSPNYELREIEQIVKTISSGMKQEVNLQQEFTLATHAKVRFYTIEIKGGKALLKLDFVEDVLSPKPKIRKIQGIPVYDIFQIYLQKITAITGTNPTTNIIGKEITGGRQEVRDMIDLYYLSKKIKPLRQFLTTIPKVYQRGIVQWQKTYSRQEFKLGFLDYDIYDKKLDCSQIIIYLDNEVQKYIQAVVL
jgi:predicted nucleotidyltransferase component of viral defense system